jgi:hypothetical protein
MARSKSIPRKRIARKGTADSDSAQAALQRLGRGDGDPPRADLRAIEAVPTATIATCLRELEEARKIALARGQAAAAISATLAKAKMAGLFAAAAASRTIHTAAPQLSLSDAARRVAFLLRLGEYDVDGETQR